MSINISSAALKGLNKGKRRPFDPLNWLDRKNTIRKDRGESYQIVKGAKAGSTVLAITPPTGEKCCRCSRPGCNLDRSVYTQYYNTFREVNGNQQNIMLADCIEILKPAKRSVEKENARKYKANTYGYSLKEIAKAARKMHDDDGKCANKNQFSVTADMEKVLFLPRLSCSSHFFKRKMSVYNLGIHVTGQEHARMCLWDETIAEHSSKDIISCLYQYILYGFKKLLRGEERTFILWSDRFVGQFNNGFMLMFMKYVVDIGFFTTFEHKFFITGHSWMSCDRDFGLIEKKFVQNSPVVPTDVEDVIRSARPSNPFEVVKMKREQFFDFTKLAEYIWIPSNLQVTKYHWYKYEKCRPKIISAKAYHNSPEWISFELRIKKPGGFTKLNKLPLSYKLPLQMTKEKAKDLRDLMTKIGDVNKYEFYDNLTKFVLNN
ncbi:unnamed protein product [Allacma fusca]|uniref:DUF7869 domain-containing protein n=1 Tax=Allacma fusca TaxID=39272 RepID=A0A8J2KFN8_9HEXA|nr:unnamed protein product [Allacma fusca]